MTLIILLIGLGAGVLSGLFGIGGGTVIVPALILLAKFEPVTATGTSLAALVLPVGILGAIEYYRNGHLDVRFALLMAIGLFCGAWFGARIAQVLAPMVLRRLFAVFLVIVAIRLWLK
ncbi:MAG TPA: sulfite exporter TauE/SafE family protein [Longimicrobiales bacterium]